MDDSRHTGLDYTHSDMSGESELTSFLEDLVEIILPETSGNVATYIPQVGSASLNPPVPTRRSGVSHINIIFSIDRP